MQFLTIPGWALLVMVAGGPSRTLTEGPGRSSPPFLAGVCWCWWRVVPGQSWRKAVGAVPRHSWLGSAAGGGEWSPANPDCGPWVQIPVIPGWGLLFVVGLLLVSGAWSSSLCVRGARRVCSCVVVCGVVFSVPFVVSSVYVSVWVWCACPRCMSLLVCV